MKAAKRSRGGMEKTQNATEQKKGEVRKKKYPGGGEKMEGNHQPIVPSVLRSHNKS